MSFLDGSGRCVMPVGVQDSLFSREYCRSERNAVIFIDGSLYPCCEPSIAQPAGRKESGEDATGTYMQISVAKDDPAAATAMLRLLLV